MANVVGGNERIRYQKGQTLEQIAKKHGVKPEDITKADGTAVSGSLMPGETLVIHHQTEPNRARAIIALLAETMEAKRAAEDARQQAEEARAQIEADKARNDAFNHAAQDFNGTVKKLRVLLSQGEGNDTTLADREKCVTNMKDLVAAAEKGLESMEPSSQEPAREVVEGLKGRVGKVDARAQAERAKLTDLDKQLDADYKAFTEMANGDKKKRSKHFGKLARELFAKYENAAKVSEGLPPDAVKALGAKIATFNQDLNRTIVRFSDESWMDREDNSYLFGRPGPKMIEHTKKVEAWLATPAGPVDFNTRTKLLEHLSEMDEAVRDFDDKVTKAAAKAVYDDLAAKVFARLSGK
jgi:hypothetical protein